MFAIYTVAKGCLHDAVIQGVQKNLVKAERMGARMIRLYFVVPAVMALLALLDMPYGYYQLLRLVVAAASVFIAVAAWQRGGHVAVMAFGLLALIYNPIVPLHLKREIWEWVNLGTAAIFLVALAVLELRRRRARRDASPLDMTGPRRL